MDPPHTIESANSSPRAGRPDGWDDHPLPPIPGAKLRLMCSYGGHIIPRPHDKSLCYVGGDTRIVVVDRHSSLADFHSRLSHSILNGRQFTLKYQLPNEDLDSLISLASDEDLENMIEEYDRTTSASPLKPSRLRLFLFPSKPETAASMGCLLDDAKSETWFVDALNGAGLLPRGLSESAAIDNLLELNSDSCTDIEAQNESSLRNNNKQVVGKSNGPEVITFDNSQTMMETSSSFGSSSSSPSMANLPPIKVRVEEYQMVGLDEQFPRNVSIASSLPSAVSPVPLPPCVSVKSSSGDDEKSSSEHGAAAATGLRKPPLPLQPVQRKFVDIHNLPSPDSKHAQSGGYNLPSPDSVKSDCSLASAGSQSMHTIYQDAVNRENRSPIDQKMTTTNIHQDPNMPPQNQQFIQHQTPNTHYIQTPMPMSSYYPIYISPQTHHQDPQQHYPTPIYINQTQTPPNTNTMVPTYQTTNGATQMLLQIPAHQYHNQQYVGHSQIVPNANNANANVNGNYGYEYGTHHMQDQIYYSQHMAAAAAASQQQPPPPPTHYQTMTPAAAAAAILSQLPPGDNAQAQQ